MSRHTIGEERRRVTITLPDRALEIALRVARKDRRDLSHEIEHLVVEAAGRMGVQLDGEPAQAAA